MNLSLNNKWCTKKGPLFIVAGPCAAESDEQLLSTAKLLKDSGKISLFRAGIWKPRTRPESFEGIGTPALSWMLMVKRETGLPVAIEVANAKHVELALKYDVDVLWLGARTTINPFSVQEIADALKGVSIPIMIKNPISADLPLWIGAIERIRNAGQNQIVAVHRGFAIGTSAQYRNYPVWKIPVELKGHFPDLPIICDPSHISGKRSLVPEVCQKALDWGMDGLMVEVHCRPEEALSDSEQQVTPEIFCQILDDLRFNRGSSGSKGIEKEIEFLRSKIGTIDQELLGILKMRMDVVEEIGKLKKKNNLKAFQSAWMNKVLEEYRVRAIDFNLGKDYVEEIYRIIHKESVKHQM